VVNLVIITFICLGIELKKILKFLTSEANKSNLSLVYMVVINLNFMVEMSFILEL